MIIYSIGHSTRPLDEFLGLLRRCDIKQLADVRAFPGSRRYPWYNRESLAAELAQRGIAYSHHPELGGRRSPLPNSLNKAWRNHGFRGYADLMETPAFDAALESLIAQATRAPTVLMCAEAVPWRCHRQLIADALVARGVAVQHILDSRISAHTMTRFAAVRDDRVSYRGDTSGTLP